MPDPERSEHVEQGAQDHDDPDHLTDRVVHRQERQEIERDPDDNEGDEDRGQHG